MKLLISVLIKTIVFTALACTLANCSPNNMAKGPGDFGGGDVNLHGVSPEQIQQEVQRVNKVKTHLFRPIRLLKMVETSDDIDKTLKENKSFSMALTKEQILHIEKHIKSATEVLFDQEPTINQVLATNDLETWLESPCKTQKGASVDESYMGSDKNKVCISGHTLSKKLNNLNASKAIFSIAMHGLAHKAGANEDQAKAIEYISYSYPDTIVESLLGYSSLSGLVYSLSQRTSQLIEVLEHLSPNSFYGSEITSEVKEDIEPFTDLLELEKTCAAFDESINQYEALIDQLKDSQQPDREETIARYISEISELKKQKQECKNSFRPFKLTLEYMTSGMIIKKNQKDLICNSISNLSPFELHSDDTTAFYLDKKQNQLIFEIHNYLFNIPLSFCAHYFVASQINNHMEEHPLHKLKKSFSERFPYDKEPGPINEEAATSLKLLLDLNDEEINKKYEYARPGNYTDLMIIMNKVNQAYAELLKSLETEN